MNKYKEMSDSQLRVEYSVVNKELTKASNKLSKEVDKNVRAGYEKTVSEIKDRLAAIISERERRKQEEREERDRCKQEQKAEKEQRKQEEREERSKRVSESNSMSVGSLRPLSDFVYLDDSKEHCTGYRFANLFDLKHKDTNEDHNMKAWGQYLSFKHCMNTSISKDGYAKLVPYDTNDVASKVDSIVARSSFFKEHKSIELVDGTPTVWWNPVISSSDVRYLNCDKEDVGIPTLEQWSLFASFTRVQAYCIGSDAVKYYYNFLAQLVQDPTNKIGHAIQYIGPEGTGKSSMIALAKSVIGSYVTVTNSNISASYGKEQLIGKLLVAFEEINNNDFDKGGAMKHFITGDTFEYDEKFKVTRTLPNYSRVIINSNTSVTNMKGDGRRWYVIHPVVSAYEAQTAWHRWYIEHKSCFDDLGVAARYFFKHYDYESNMEFLTNARGDLISQQLSQASSFVQRLYEYLENPNLIDVDLSTTQEFFNQSMSMYKDKEEGKDNTITLRISQIKDMFDSTNDMTTTSINKLFNCSAQQPNGRILNYDVKYDKNEKTYSFTKRDTTTDELASHISLKLGSIDLLNFSASQVETVDTQVLEGTPYADKKSR